MIRTLNAAIRTAAASFDGGFAATQGGGNENAVVDDTSFPDNWYDLWEQREPLDWEAFLKSDLLMKERSNRETHLIIERTSGSISIMSSALLIVHVLRSHQGLSTTYHRLILGLSVADILYSSANYLLNSFMVPMEMAYLIPGAQGNVKTCAAQGFFTVIGFFISAYYNCSICFYYLAIIKYNKSDAYIAKKLERWFHGIPIMVVLMIGFLILAVKGYNAWGTGGRCFFQPNNPPHCIGYGDGEIVDGFSIPCGRGNAFYNNYESWIIFLALISPPPIVIVTTMVMMYRTVVKIERKAARYGVRALRLHAQQERRERAENSLNEDDARPLSMIEKIQHCISCWLCSLWYFLTCRNNINTGSDANDVTAARRRRRSNMGMGSSPRSNTSIRVASRKRAILLIASGFVAAWALVWIPGLIFAFFPSFEASIIASLFPPLQGLFNFIVFMSPKARAAKKLSRRTGQQKEEGELSWCKAIIKSYMSRGKRLRP